MATADTLLTAEEYRLLPDNDRPTELVRGRIVTLNMPTPRHAYFCGKIVHLLATFLDEHDLGRVMSNDSGVVTERDPDSVRGVDVAYFSYTRLPRGSIPEGYLDVVPELVFEVRSPTDRWREILAKVAEYLNAGVVAVCVLDPPSQTLTVYHEDELPRVLNAEEELTLPGLLGDFRVPIRRFLD